MSRHSVPVARRNVLADRQRLAIATVGVGLAVGLMLLIEGLWGGMLAGITAYPDNVGASLFVQQPGALILAEGSIPLADVATIRQIPGVAQASPVIDRYVILNSGGTKEAVNVVGVEAGGLGGPWRLTAGRMMAAPGELVMDESLARSNDLRAGDAFRLMGGDFRVTGLSASTRSLAGGGFLFMSFADAQALFHNTNTATFVLVRGADPAALQTAITSATGLSASTPSVVAQAERDLYASILGQVFNVVVIIAFVAGTLIVAMTVYSAIADHLREYGVAKALGARPAKLFQIVAGQTMVLAALGVAVGFGVFATSARVIVAIVPRFPSVLSLEAALGVMASALVMALLAAIVPTRVVARLDPATVYRG